MTEGIYDPEDRVTDEETIEQIMNIIMDHMFDAMRLACVERRRRKCFNCIALDAQNGVNKFFERHTPKEMERIGINEYMSLVVRFGRREAFRLLKEYECEDVHIDTDLFIDGNTTCH